MVRRCFWALLLGGCAVARSATPPLVVEAQGSEAGVASEWDREPSVLAAEVETDGGDDEGAEAWPEFLARLDLHSPSIDALTTRIRALADIPAFLPVAPKK